MKNKIKVIAVVGPTASGKSELAMNLALALDGEIVSCDSMQIYKEMDIGTAKPNFEERKKVVHHLVDFVDYDSNYTVADYVKDASGVIEKIAQTGRQPILCGGTGLYLDTLLRGGNLSPDISPDAIEKYKDIDNEELFRRLEKVDKKSAEIIHVNNRRRVERALAIFEETGIAKSEWDLRSREAEKPYDSLLIGINYRDREKLYERINLRVDRMFDMGLADEVRRVNPKRNTTAGQAIGYKEILDCFDGLCSLEEAREKIKQNTRNYAKRQLTWFNKNKEINWIYADEENDVFESAMKIIEKGGECNGKSES